MIKTILMLAANPKDTPRLRLDQEVREIEDGLRRAQKRDDFILKQEWATRPIDVRRAMLDYKPNIVHFCGHGAGEEGLAFEDETGRTKLISTDALSGFFELFADKVECVVLNACYSEVQAEAIAKHIPHVIGMRKAINDTTAIEFAVALYDALGAGETVEFAYKLACNAIQWISMPEHLTPILKSKTPISSQTSQSYIDAQTYLTGVIEKYKVLESYYTNLPVSIHPQIPTGLFPTLLDISSFQILVERNFGKEYHTIERVRKTRIQDVTIRHPQIVLLGDPGCGKTITLWKLALDYANNAIANIDLPWPILIELGQFDGSIRFYDWLLSKCKVIPGFFDRLKSGSLLFLLDGLNEMPRTGYSESLEELRKFITDNPYSKIVVTCRRLDYDESLGLQQVEIEPLDNKNIRAFIANYIKGEYDVQHLYELLESDVRLLELAGSVINLSLIIALYDLCGEKFPRNRSKLLDFFIGALYEREKNKLKVVTLTETEVRSLLGILAFNIQTEVGKGTYVDRDWALQYIQTHNIYSTEVSLIDFAKNMGLLETTKSALRFQHQLIQEYFVALEFEKHLIDIESRKRYWIPRLTIAVASQESIQPLPPPPTTGWEEATIMLSGAKDDASGLVEQIAELNPVLAARCISEGRAFIRFATHEIVVKRLLRLIDDSSYDLSIRIQAGTLIGELDDPRFRRLALPKGYAMLPQMVSVPEGDYYIGSNRDEVSESYLDEVKRHKVNTNPFQIGKFPITNAEFDCFIRSDGYDKREYWTDQGWSWRQGQIKADLKQWILSGYRNVRNQVLQEKERLEPSHAEDSEEMDVWWKILMEWSDEKAEIELDKIFKDRNDHPHSIPSYWNDPLFNKKAQPVITTWFEAQAYCSWLSKITNRCYRLPTEAEWEASTGGSTQKYPWGSEADLSKYNILPTRVLRTTPVGIFPNGISKFGVYDLIGNVWEWTSSAKFSYPYNKDDGRENPFLSDCRRVVRGGSWAVSASSARNSCRGNFPPDNMVRNYIGFRVACDE